jgi:hypothetical protein
VSSVVGKIKGAKRLLKQGNLKHLSLLTYCCCCCSYDDDDDDDEINTEKIPDLSS